jgi:hypothetical protein
LPPKPKITPVVCVGLSRPKLDQPASKARSGHANWAATQTPMNIPNTAQAIESAMPALMGSS